MVCMVPAVASTHILESSCLHPFNIHQPWYFFPFNHSDSLQKLLGGSHLPSGAPAIQVHHLPCIPIDFHIFQRGSNHQPVGNCSSKKRPFTRGSKTTEFLSGSADASCEGTAAWLLWNEGNCAGRIAHVDGRYCLDSFEVIDLIWIIYVDSIWFYTRVHLNHIYSGHRMASFTECSTLSHQFAWNMHPDMSPSQFILTSQTFGSMINQMFRQWLLAESSRPNKWHFFCWWLSTT